MSEVKRYHVTEAGLVEGQALGRINVVLGADHDRVTAECDALQVLLTTADEKNDTLAMAYLRANDREHELRKEIVLLRAALKFYADSDHYSTDDGLNWDSCSGEPANILWHESEPWFVEDGSIARAALAHSVEAADQEEVQQCQFPQACPSNCGCDIPDFTPGNGNKARRRAAAIEALKPENQRITPIDHGTKAGFCNCNQGRLPCTCKPSAYDGFDNGVD